MKLIVLYCAVCALLLGTVSAKALVEKDGQVEQSTESPIADMALVDTKVEDMHTESVKAQAMNASDKEKVMNDSQQHTIADFIIQPLIALKPHVPEAEGKQADTSSTTPSPWQLFGFNAGQGLGSQVSSLAGSVTGWLGNRIQLPGLVDTPVRESTTTTTTTTTPKPDVVVRVKQRASTKKPLISIKGDERPYRRKTKRPNRFNNWDDEDDEDFDDDDEEEEEEVVYNNNNNNKRRRYQNNNHNDDDAEEEDDDDDEDSNVNNNEQDDEDEDNEVEYNRDDEQAEEDEEEEEEEPPKPVKQNQRRRHPRPLNQRRRINQNQGNNQRRRLNNNNSNTSRKQQQQRRKPYQEESEEIEQDDEDDNEEAEAVQQQDFYYHNRNPSSKRSQTEQNFIQRGQETLIKQIQQFTGGQTPAEVTQTMRKNKKSVNKNKQRNQATLIIKRNGQAVYVAPELLQVTDALSGNGKPVGQHISVTTNQVKKQSHYPQPPLTVPYKRKGKPTQYITIPWSQLGISPPDDLTALTNGMQSQPLILNIPQSAIDSMQYPKLGKRKQAITPESVPLLADASIMDIFKPPRIPPARTPSTTMKPIKKVPAQHYSPVVIATKTGPTRIRPGTVVEKAPADEQMTSEEASEDETSPQMIVIGDEHGERQLTRNEYRKILEFFNQRAGRQLKHQQEQLIPVKVVEAEDNSATKVTETPIDNSLKQESKMEIENATEIPVVDSLKQGSGMGMENATEIPSDSSLKQEADMELENATEIPIDNNLKQESPADDVTESIVENATESPVNV